jgi:hypothetical protein
VNKSQLQYCFFEITWQQASKHINKSIIVATLSMYRSGCLVVSGEKEEKESFEVPGPSLFQLVKATFLLVKGTNGRSNIETPNLILRIFPSVDPTTYKVR